MKSPTKLLITAALATALVLPVGSVEARQDDRCRDVYERIDKARDYIGEWDGTGRHEKATRWYKDDLRKAMRERAEYCAGDNGRGRGWGWGRHKKHDRRDRDDWWERRDRDRDDYDRRDRDRWWNRSSYDPSYDPGYDDRSYDDGSYADGDFDIKRDWPSLLGLFVNPGALGN